MDDPHCDLEHLLETSRTVAEGRGIVLMGLMLYQYDVWGGNGRANSVVLLLQRDASVTAYKRIGLIDTIPMRLILEEKPEETITII